jgi:hypothetical protein
VQVFLPVTETIRKEKIKNLIAPVTGGWMVLLPAR